MKLLLGFIRKHIIIFSVAGAIAIGLFVWLFFFVFAFHLAIFNIDKKVDEANPFAPTTTSTIADSTATTSPPVATTTTRQSPKANFINRSHPTTGEVFLVTDGNETYLRFENFETDNGPALFVYLSNVPDGSTSEARNFDDDFVNLGRLKGTIGNQNYLIPAGTDLSKYNTVAIWCDPFNAIFGAADLQQLP